MDEACGDSLASGCSRISEPLGKPPCLGVVPVDLMLQSAGSPQPARGIVLTCQVSVQRTSQARQARRAYEADGKKTTSHSILDAPALLRQTSK